MAAVSLHPFIRSPALHTAGPNMASGLYLDPLVCKKGAFLHCYITLPALVVSHSKFSGLCRQCLMLAPALLILRIHQQAYSAMQHVNGKLAAQPHPLQPTRLSSRVPSICNQYCKVNCMHMNLQWSLVLMFARSEVYSQGWQSASKQQKLQHLIHRRSCLPCTCGNSLA